MNWKRGFIRDRIYLLDLWRAQTSADEWIKSWCDLVRKWKPLDWAEEMGHSLTLQ